MVRNIDPPESAVIRAPQHMNQRTVGTLDTLVDDTIVRKVGIVDVAMDGVQSVDSAGLNWLIAVNERLQSLNMKLRLADPPELVQDILLATRLDTRFAVHCSMGAMRHA
ncbi:MAG TPA: STAS domain-containing protein [Phycisphaerae bacterium]|jgi:anti-anti-sigma factor|nr:STAS domain-containing protein [Phycisphaerae bacterium]